MGLGEERVPIPVDLTLTTCSPTGIIIPIVDLVTDGKNKEQDDKPMKYLYLSTGTLG